jgi:Holliday junction resolvase RusA-like endonuclease
MAPAPLPAGLDPIILLSPLTTTRISFVVPGRPCGKQSMRFTKSGRSYQPADVLAYKDKISFYAQQASNGGLMEGPLEINVVARFMIPRSWSKKRQLAAQWHSQKPDVDNLLKALLDGLKQVVIRDDAQVCRIELEKVWTRDAERLEMSIVEMTPARRRRSP